MLKIKYLVTGTGRCGTVYMARLLTSLGINCVHEGIFTFDGPNQKIIAKMAPAKNSFCSTHDMNRKSLWTENLQNVQAESSFIAAPFLDHKVLKNTKIIHLVRHPLKVISSIKDVNFSSPKGTIFIHRILPEIEKITNIIEKSCYYYIYWNKLIESKINHVFMRHKVENNCSQELLDFLGVQKTESVFSDITINSWKLRSDDLKLKEIPNGSLKDELVKMSDCYGYEI